jgi:ATP-binding cassette subfamily C (CFTR/MRP) protein 1
MIDEDRQKGKLSWQIIGVFLSKVGGFSYLLPAFSCAIVAKIFEMYSYIYLSGWSANFNEEDKWAKFKTFATIMTVSPILHGLRKFFMILASYYLSTKIHGKMIYSILHSQVEEFINRVPGGRILNRFTNDLEKIDRKVGQELGSLLYYSCMTFVDIVTYGFLIGYEVVLCLVLMVILSIYFQRIFMYCRREFIRIESITRSPIVSFYMDAVKGLPFIRSYGKVDQFFDIFKDKIEECSKNSFVVFALNGWYQLRILFISICVVLIPSYSILIFLKQNLVIEDVVIFIMIGTGLSSNLSDVLDRLSNFESAMISVERCTHFEKITPESQYRNYEQQLDAADGAPTSFAKLQQIKMKSYHQVITEGRITFKNLSAKYATNPNPVLKNLSFEIRPKEKIGIIGRTGSGKSSLIKMLWRSMDPSEGQILVDGADITQVDLKSYRSQMLVVTQETALIEGTLQREHRHFGDRQEPRRQMMGVLRRLGFENEEFLKAGLDMKVNADGSNLSAGEKQVISFSQSPHRKEEADHS